MIRGPDAAIVNLYQTGDQVEGIERSTGDELPSLSEIVMRLTPTSTQKLAVRQAGEMVQAEWTGYIDPPGDGKRRPRKGDTVELVHACYANSPLSDHEGKRFEVADSPIATTREIRLSLTEVGR